MQLADVIGVARATHRIDALSKERLVVIQPIDQSESADGPPLLALDRSGCGPGDRVIITSDGRQARTLTGVDNTPGRWTVLGLVDPKEEKNHREGNDG